MTPSRKATRKRGQRGETAVGAKRNPKRQANRYKTGALFESPMAPTPGTRVSTQDQAKAIDPPDFSSIICENVGDVLRAFDFSENVEHVLGRLPSLQMRMDPDTWLSSDPSAPASFTKKILITVIQRVCDVFCGNSTDGGAALMESIISNSSASTAETNAEVRGVVAECYTKARKGSVEKHVLRTLVCALPRRQVDEYKLQLQGFSISRDSFSAGRRDLVRLKNGLKIVKETRTVQRFDAQSVEGAVAFILGSENVSFLSWGTKRVLLDGRSVHFPAVMRRKSRTHIFEEYLVKEFSGQQLSRATFFRVLSAITAGDSRMRKAVDYVVGFLINDSFDTLRQILSTLHMQESV